VNKKIRDGNSDKKKLKATELALVMISSRIDSLMINDTTSYTGIPENPGKEYFLLKFNKVSMIGSPESFIEHQIYKNNTNA